MRLAKAVRSAASRAPSARALHSLPAGQLPPQLLYANVLSRLGANWDSVFKALELNGNYMQAIKHIVVPTLDLVGLRAEDLTAELNELYGFNSVRALRSNNNFDCVYLHPPKYRWLQNGMPLLVIQQFRTGSLVKDIGVDVADEAILGYERLFTEAGSDAETAELMDRAEARCSIRRFDHYHKFHPLLAHLFLYPVPPVSLVIDACFCGGVVEGVMKLKNKGVQIEPIHDAEVIEDVGNGIAYALVKPARKETDVADGVVAVSSSLFYLTETLPGFNGRNQKYVSPALFGSQFSNDLTALEYQRVAYSRS